MGSPAASVPASPIPSRWKQILPVVFLKAQNIFFPSDKYVFTMKT